MIYVKQNVDVYEITFRYDPVVISHIKNIPGRRWIPETKVWTIPADRLGWLLNEFKGTQYEKYVQIQSKEDLNVNETLDTTTVIPEVDISSVPFYVKEGATPYKHQLDFMKYAIDRQNHGLTSGFLLADDQGLAKTCETMNLAIYNRDTRHFKRCLVICCINSSKFNWKRDIEEHTRNKEHPYILGTRLKRNGALRFDGSKEKLEDLQTLRMYGDKKGQKLPYFIILNIEAVRYKVGKKYPIAEQIVSLINSGEISMIAVDEIHKNASMTSAQGKQLLAIKKATGGKVLWLPMTGTPITKKPTDVFLPLKLTDSHNYNSYYSWCNQFCVYGGFGGHEIMGYKNIPRLKSILQGNMIRRLKSEVLDLPPKIQYTEYVDNTPYQQDLYDRVANDILAERNVILNSMNPMAKLLRLRQVNGSPELIDPSISLDKDYINKNAKLKRLLELIEECVERDEKVIVFSNWVEPLRTLYKFITPLYKTCCFVGTMKDTEREKHKQVFQNNPNYKVLLGTIGAAGTTHTFTAATNVIFYDEPWNPSDKVQAEDRAYRIGTAGSSVNIYTLISQGTVDDRVHDILSTKDGVSKYIVDDQLDLRKNPALFDLLFQDTLRHNK